MTKFKNGLLFAMESSENSEAVDEAAMPEQEIAALETIIGTQFRDLKNQVYEVDLITDSSVVVEKIADIFSEASENGGAGTTAVRLAKISVSRLSKTLGVSDTFLIPSLESFSKDRSTRIYTTKIAVENIGELVKKAIDRTIEFIRTTAKKLFAFLLNLRKKEQVVEKKDSPPPQKNKVWGFKKPAPGEVFESTELYLSFPRNSPVSMKNILEVSKHTKDVQEFCKLFYKAVNSFVVKIKQELRHIENVDEHVDQDGDKYRHKTFVSTYEDLQRNFIGSVEAAAKAFLIGKGHGVYESGPLVNNRVFVVKIYELAAVVEEHNLGLERDKPITAEAVDIAGVHEIAALRTRIVAANIMFYNATEALWENQISGYCEKILEKLKRVLEEMERDNAINRRQYGDYKEDEIKKHIQTLLDIRDEKIRALKDIRLGISNLVSLCLKIISRTTEISSNLCSGVAMYRNLCYTHIRYLKDADEEDAASHV